MTKIFTQAGQKLDNIKPNTDQGGAAQSGLGRKKKFVQILLSSTLSVLLLLLSTAVLCSSSHFVM